MARSIERRICGDCGAMVNKKFHDCPKCGALIPIRKRRINTPTVDPECDGVRETYRSLSSRLGEGFGMMNDGFEWIDRVFADERTPAFYDEPDVE